MRTWGTLREALRDGETRARVNVASIASPGLVGIGAVAGLDGEITIVDGRCVVSRVRPGTVATSTVATSTADDVAATILFVADVREWRKLRLGDALTMAELETRIGRLAQEYGLDPDRPFPFVVKGRFAELDLHVLAGECPIRARMLGRKMESPPFEKKYTGIEGRLVGIFARKGAGTITHHGSVSHIHALVESGSLVTGHCESVSLEPGAILALPSGAASPADR